MVVSRTKLPSVWGHSLLLNQRLHRNPDVIPRHLDAVGVLDDTLPLCLQPVNRYDRFVFQHRLEKQQYNHNSTKPESAPPPSSSFTSSPPPPPPNPEPNKWRGILQEKFGPLVFRVISTHRDDLVLRAESKEGMNDWLFGFHRALASIIARVIENKNGAGFCVLGARGGGGGGGQDQGLDRFSRGGGFGDGGDDGGDRGGEQFLPVWYFLFSSYGVADLKSKQMLVFGCCSWGVVAFLYFPLRCCSYMAIQIASVVDGDASNRSAAATVLLLSNDGCGCGSRLPPIMMRAVDSDDAAGDDI